MLSNKHNTVLYTGTTTDLVNRIWEHKEGCVKGFTKQYNCHKLVWFECGGSRDSALEREKQIKKLSRARKNALVEIDNPDWSDLALDWFDR